MFSRYRLGTACVASAALLYVAWVATCGGVRRVGLPPRGESTKSTRSVLLLGDLHIAGPELELDAESNPMDSISVLKAASRLYRVLEQRRKHEPSLVLVLGDVVHDGLRVLEDPNSAASLQRDLFDKAVNGYTIASGLFAEFLPGARIMWTFGNHDGLVTCGQSSKSIDRTLLASVYRRYFNNADPFAVFDDPSSNWSVVSLNGLWGETWDPTSPRCNTELASFGAPQLVWLEEVLRKRHKRGRYVLISTHFPLTATVVNEHDSELSLLQLLETYPCVRGILTGHFHKGIEWSDVTLGAEGAEGAEGGAPLPVITLPAVRYSANNSFLLDLESDGTWSIRDFLQKNKHGARCSLGDRSLGNLGPSGARRGDHHGATDVGDCGVPLVNHESESVLPPISSMGEFPDPTEFNPEGSCRPQLAIPFFTGTCTPDTIDFGDNERACCDILQEAFWPGSSHPFSTCLCLDTFWDAVVQQVYGQGGDQALVDVLRRCDRRGTFLIWPRRRSEELGLRRHQAVPATHC